VITGETTSEKSIKMAKNVKSTKIKKETMAAYVTAPDKEMNSNALKTMNSDGRKQHLLFCIFSLHRQNQIILITKSPPQRKIFVRVFLSLITL
jgi:hypothetical protein